MRRKTSIREFSRNLLCFSANCSWRIHTPIYSCDLFRFFSFNVVCEDSQKLLHTHTCTWNLYARNQYYTYSSISLLFSLFLFFNEHTVHTYNVFTNRPIVELVIFNGHQIQCDGGGSSSSNNNSEIASMWKDIASSTPPPNTCADTLASCQWKKVTHSRFYEWM